MALFSNCELNSELLVKTVFLPSFFGLTLSLYQTNDILQQMVMEASLLLLPVTLAHTLPRMAVRHCRFLCYPFVHAVCVIARHPAGPATFLSFSVRLNQDSIHSTTGFCLTESQL